VAEDRSRDSANGAPRAGLRSRLPANILASLALMLAGVAALAFMAPQFAIYIPVLAAAWMLARFGLVPRGLHASGESVRIAGGPAAGALTFAEVTITTTPSRRKAGLALAHELIAAAQATMGAAIEGPDDTLVAWAGDATPLDACASPDAAAWAARWPRLVREQAERRASLALEVATESGSSTIVRAACVGDRAVLAALLIRFARDVRDRPGVEAWITGWLRDAERASLPRRG
jgi:hypothetical protein